MKDYDTTNAPAEESGFWSSLKPDFLKDFDFEETTADVWSKIKQPIKLNETHWLEDDYKENRVWLISPVKEVPAMLVSSIDRDNKLDSKDHFKSALHGLTNAAQCFGGAVVADIIASGGAVSTGVGVVTRVSSGTNGLSMLVMSAAAGASIVYSGCIYGSLASAGLHGISGLTDKAFEKWGDYKETDYPEPKSPEPEPESSYKSFGTTFQQLRHAEPSLSL